MKNEIIEPQEGLSDQPVQMKSNKLKLLYLSIIIVLTCIAYSNSLNNEFALWDDDAQVVNNNVIKDLTIGNVTKISYKFLC